jgi:hypothetical protein
MKNIIVDNKIYEEFKLLRDSDKDKRKTDSMFIAEIIKLYKKPAKKITKKEEVI